MNIIRVAAFAAFAFCATAVVAQPLSCSTLPNGVPRAHFTEEISSAAVADFDGDGHDDIVTTGDKVSILYGRGDGTFERAVSIADPGFASNLFAADLNADGREDLVAGNGWTLVILNEGDRRWAPLEPALERSSGVRAVVDVTRDGHLDIVARLQDGGIAVLTNNGDATFGIRVTRTPSYIDFAAGDLDADGYVDVVTSDGSRVYLLRGDGSGTFSSRIEILAAQAEAWPHLIDVTSDGRLDLLIDAGDKLYLYKGPIAGPVSAPYTQIAAAYFVGFADYNGDGAADLLAGSHTDPIPRLLLNDGAGVFRPATVTLPGGPVATGDFNRDGAIDLVIGLVTHAAIALGRDDLTFAMPGHTAPAKSIVVGTLDLERDGSDELVVFDGARLHVGRAQQGTLAYTFEELPFPVELKSSPRTKNIYIANEGMLGDATMAAGDVHPSPGRELLLASGKDVRTFSRIGAGQWRERTVYSFARSIEALASANLNELDGQDEMAVVLAGGTLEVHRASGETLFQQKLECSPWCGRDFSLQVRDLDGDRHLDLLLADSGSWVYHPSPVHGYVPYDDGKVIVFRGRGNGTFESGRTVVTGMHIADISAGDFNGDGHVDLVLTRLYTYAGEALVSYGTTTGAFEKPRSLTGARDSYYAPAHAVADVNGDGHDDLVLHRDAVLTYFYGTPGGLLEHGRYLGTDLPYIARRSSSRFPGVVYSSVPGELVVLENECVPVRRRGVRH